MNEPWPPEVRVTDFGIRSYDLAYALMDGKAIIVVEKHADVFMLEDRGWSQEMLGDWIRAMNQTLGLTAKDVALIVASSDMEINEDTE